MLTSTVPAADLPTPDSGGTARERRQAKSRRRRTLRVVIGATLVVLVVIGGGLAWYLVSQTEELAARTSAARELLLASDGKVAEPGTRGDLSEEITQAETVLAEPVLTRIITGTVEARDDLGAASDTVRASMVEHARSEVTAERTGLVTVGARGEKVYAATEGLGADDGVRTRLRSALDAVAAVDVAADSSLGGGDLAELQRVAVDLSATRSAVTVATRALSGAQDKITCPAPDQVWDPDSGRVPSSALSPIPWAPGHFVRTDVLDELVALDAAYSEAFGEHLTINSSYRTYASQASLYDPSSPIAAPPGCSNHGLGLAVDIGGGVETFDTAPYDWLKANAQAYGWIHPAFAEPNGRVPEPWHWQSVLARESS